MQDMRLHKRRELTPMSNAKVRKPRPKRMTPEQQHARFVEAAKRAEVDEAPGAMDKAFKRLSIKKGSRAQ